MRLPVAAESGTDIFTDPPGRLTIAGRISASGSPDRINDDTPQRSTLRYRRSADLDAAARSRPGRWTAALCRLGRGIAAHHRVDPLARPARDRAGERGTSPSPRSIHTGMGARHARPPGHARLVQGSSEIDRSLDDLLLCPVRYPCRLGDGGIVPGPDPSPSSRDDGTLVSLYPPGIPEPGSAAPPVRVVAPVTRPHPGTGPEVRLAGRPAGRPPPWCVPRSSGCLGHPGDRWSARSPGGAWPRPGRMMPTSPGASYRAVPDAGSRAG